MFVHSAMSPPEMAKLHICYQAQNLKNGNQTEIFDFIDESSEGRWYWTYSLQVANFTAWAQNEPDDGIMGDYASLKADEYSWDDETPTSTAYPICQFFV